jgi:hypothetical protein
MRDLAYCVETRRSSSNTSSMADSSMLTMYWGVTIKGPSVLLTSTTCAGRVSARCEDSVSFCEESRGGRDGRGFLVSTNLANSSVRP